MDKGIYDITEDTNRILMHIPIGLLACVLAFAHWVLALVFVGSFLYYELNQDLYLSDKAYKDVKGLIWGIGIGGCIWFGLKVRGIL